MLGENEKIVDFNGYEELYSISNHGWIISKDTGDALKPRMTKMKEYVRLYKDQVMTIRNVDECVCEHFHKNYIKGEVVWHKDNDPHNNHIDNLLFKNRFNIKDFFVYYENADGKCRIWENKTKEIKTIPQLDVKAYNYFHLFKGYENRDANNKLLPMTDEQLMLFVNDFLGWVAELKTNDIFKMDYVKIFCHFNAVKNVLDKLTVGKLDQFKPITVFEHNLFNKCYNAGLTFCLPGVYECFSYDFNAKYPRILRSNKLRIGLGEPIDTTLESLPSMKSIQLGIYRIKITCSNPDFLKVFSFSKYHHYTDESVKFALKYKKRFGVKLELIQDEEPNAYIYDKYTTGDKVFDTWFDTLIELKQKLPKNKLVKHLLSSVWGAICHPTTINKTYEEIIDEGIKIDEDYEILEHVWKNDGREYYELIPMKGMYRYNIRIKPFLTAIARNDIAEVILDGNNIDNCVRVQTDSATFTEPIEFSHFDNLILEEKTTGLIKWNHVNSYKKIPTDE
jgi:hypothetical protein